MDRVPNQPGPSDPLDSSDGNLGRERDVTRTKGRKQTKQQAGKKARRQAKTTTLQPNPRGANQKERKPSNANLTDRTGTGTGQQRERKAPKAAKRHNKAAPPTPGHQARRKAKENQPTKQPTKPKRKQRQKQKTANEANTTQRKQGNTQLQQPQKTQNKQTEATTCSSPRDHRNSQQKETHQTAQQKETQPPTPQKQTPQGAHEPKSTEVPPKAQEARAPAHQGSARPLHTKVASSGSSDQAVKPSTHLRSAAS